MPSLEVFYTYRVQPIPCPECGADMALMPQEPWGKYWICENYHRPCPHINRVYAVEPTVLRWVGMGSEKGDDDDRSD